MSGPGGMDEAADARGGRTTIYFQPHRGGYGLRIEDPVERRQFDIHTEDSVSPTPSRTDQFIAPVDAATSIRTRKLTYPTIVAMYVRDEAGDLVLEAEHGITEELPADTYIIELDPPIKIYLKVKGPLTVKIQEEKTSLSFSSVTNVEVGARSRHTQPATTITTTDDPRDLMRTVSILSSALKTTSVERSYPTLRGHPPLVELGNSLEIPQSLKSPETGVTIELPTGLETLLEAAPLVYYLGADIRVSDSPAIATETGFSHPLDGGSSFRHNVARVLKHVFLLDCVTRTEGIYNVELSERRELSTVIDLDYQQLYKRPLAERIEEYLQISEETIAELLPAWKLTAHVPPEPASIEVLPFALNELALINAHTRETSASETSLGSGGLRGDADLLSVPKVTGAKKRRKDTPRPATATLGHVWFGAGTPEGATKATLAAYRNRLEKTPTAGNILIAVVLNDERMEQERKTVESIYGPRKNLPFDVEFHRELAKNELRTLLRRDLDFIHYIGHVDDTGFECTDGTLAVDSIEQVGVDSFFLNACRSYQQGIALVDRGAIGGVVTRQDIVNTEAIELGRTLAKLLHLGFPLRPAIDLAKGESLIGNQYVVIGDGETAVAQSESGVVLFGQFENRDGGYRVALRTYPTLQKGMGSLIHPTIGEDYIHYLNGGTIGPIELTESEVATFLHRQEMPILVDGQIRWSTELEPTDVV